MLKLDHLPISNLCKASLYNLLTQYRAFDGDCDNLPGHTWSYDGERYYVQHVQEGELTNGFEGCVFRCDDTRLLDPEVGMIQIDELGVVRGLPSIGWMKKGI